MNIWVVSRIRAGVGVGLGDHGSVVYNIIELSSKHVEAVKRRSCVDLNSTRRDRCHSLSGANWEDIVASAHGIKLEVTIGGDTTDDRAKSECGGLSRVDVNVLDHSISEDVTDLKKGIG